MVTAELPSIQKEELQFESMGERLCRAQSLGPLTEPEQEEVREIAAQIADARAKNGEITDQARAQWDIEGATYQVLFARLKPQTTLNHFLPH